MEIVLDAKRFKGRTRAHAYLKEALRLPDYYGKIWTHYMIAWVTSEKKRSS